MDARLLQPLQRSLDQLRTDSSATVIRQDGSVVKISPAAVVAAENGAHIIAVFPGRKAGGGISFQECFHSFPGIIRIVQPHPGTASPEPIDSVIVLRFHRIDRGIPLLYFSALNQYSIFFLILQHQEKRSRPQAAPKKAEIISCLLPRLSFSRSWRQ